MRLRYLFLLSILGSSLIAAESGDQILRSEAVTTVTTSDGRTFVGRLTPPDRLAVPVNGGFSELLVPSGSTVATANGALPVLDAYRLPAAARVRETIGKSALLKSVQQIPAFVVKDGPLAYVPYQSFRSGEAEINLYGDLDHPCAMEIGLYGSWGKDGAMWRYAADAMARWASLHEQSTPAVIDANDFMDAATRIDFSAGGQAKFRGMVIDITPPSAPDAFGAWWIGISDPVACNVVRAPPAVTAALIDPVDGSANAVVDQGGADSSQNWSGADVKRTFRASRQGGGGGPVYVRGYTRSNGSYVSGHSRSR